LVELTSNVLGCRTRRSHIETNIFKRSNRLLKFTQPSTPAEQREKMTASPDEQ